MNKFLLGLVYHRKEVLQGDIVNSGGVPVGADSGDEPVIRTYFHPETHLLELAWNHVGHDQMGPRPLGLSQQGLWGGENYLGSGTFFAKVESEYFPVHLWLDAHQHPYYYCHERGTPSVHGNKVHADGGHRECSGVYRNHCIKIT